MDDWDALLPRPAGTEEEIRAKAAEQNKKDEFSPLDFAKPSWDAAVERFRSAGVTDVDPDDPALFNAYKRSVDYFADMGLAGLELSDAAFKSVIGTVAEFIPGQSDQQERRFERDVYSMPEAFAGISPGKVQQSADAVSDGIKHIGGQAADFLPGFLESEAGHFGPEAWDLQSSNYRRSTNPTANNPRPEEAWINPVDALLENLEVPEKGIRGAELKKKLETDPQIRGSFLSALDLPIDPQKRYTDVDLEELRNLATYQVQATNMADTGSDAFGGYQRQDQVGWLGSPTKDYIEVTVDAFPGDLDKNFRANDQHFTGQTLSHARASVREDSRGDFILVEELQSDLLQKGYAKPQKGMSSEEAGDKLKKDAEVFFDEKISSAPDDQSAEIYEAQKAADLKVIDAITRGDIHYAANQDKVMEIARTISDETGAGFQKTLDFIGQELEAFESLNISIGKPPIKKTKESVDASLKGLIAEAQKKGVNRIVLPPFEKIIEARFSSLENIEKAMDPKSGFSRTYIDAVNESLMELQKNYPEVTIQSVPLPYSNAEAVVKSVTSRIGSDFVFNNSTGDYSAEILEDLVTRYVSRKRDNAEGFTFRDDEDFKLFGELMGLDKIPEGVTTEQVLTTLHKTLEDVRTGVEIDISKLSEKYDLTRPRFNKGGLVANYNEGGQVEQQTRQMPVDPVSGNEIPPGASAEEVRDDVDAKLSAGEYVVPADVVQYFGVRFFEDLRAKAKEGLMQMEQNGRVGGEPAMAGGEGEDLSPEEMQMLMEVMEQGGGGQPQGQQAPVMMNKGGLVEKGQEFNFGTPEQYGAWGVSRDWGMGAVNSEYRTYINDKGEEKLIFFMNGQPTTPIPDGYMPKTPETEKAVDQNKPAVESKSAIPDKWTGEDNFGVNKGTESAEGEGSQRSWNPGVDLTNPEVAEKYAADQLKNWERNQTMTGNVARGLSGISPILGLAGSAIGAMRQGNRLANARAAAKIQEMLGHTDAAAKIQSMIPEEIPGLMDRFTTGDKFAERWLNDRLDPYSDSAPLSRLDFGSDEAFNQVMQKAAPPGGEYVPSTGSYRQSDTGDSDSNKGAGDAYAERVGAEQVGVGEGGTNIYEANEETTRPQARPSSFNKGGLVKRPEQKKKVPARKKGLASKK